MPAEKSGGRIKPSNTQGPVGAGTCSALLEECNQYFSSPKAGLLFFLYLMSFHAATSLAALFCLCPWARSILLQLIFQSESLRVRATPLSFPCCGGRSSPVSGGGTSPCPIATSAQASQGMHSWQQEASGALVWGAALGRAPGWRCGVWEEISRARGWDVLGEQQGTP